MAIILHQIVSVDMSQERAEAFLRFCQYEALYNQLGAELLNAKPEEINNGKIMLFIQKGQWIKTQRFDEIGKKTA